MISISSLLLVGCGNMGGALLERWQRGGLASRIDVIEPNPPTGASRAATWHKQLDSLPESCAPAVVVFAVKPQQMEHILPAFAARFGNAPIYLSIAAGKDMRFLSSWLGEEARIVRAMPNTPALVQQGMTVLYARPSLADADRQAAAALMQAVGKVEWIDDEALMDAVTALSGSGPAYLFLFLDCLTQAGVKLGLPEPLARTLALQTVAGSCALAGQSGESFELLRKNVTSPGGTTEAALRVLMQTGALEKLIENALLAAKMRSLELK